MGSRWDNSIRPTTAIPIAYGLLKWGSTPPFESRYSDSFRPNGGVDRPWFKKMGSDHPFQMGPIGGSDHPFQMGHGDPFEMGDPTPLLDSFEMGVPTNPPNKVGGSLYPIVTMGQAASHRQVHPRRRRKKTPMPKQRNGHISTPRRPQKLSIGPFDAEFQAGGLGRGPEA